MALLYKDCHVHQQHTACYLSHTGTIYSCYSLPMCHDNQIQATITRCESLSNPAFASILIAFQATTTICGNHVEQAHNDMKNDLIELSASDPEFMAEQFFKILLSSVNPLQHPLPISSLLSRGISLVDFAVTQ